MELYWSDTVGQPCCFAVHDSQHSHASFPFWDFTLWNVYWIVNMLLCRSHMSGIASIEGQSHFYISTCGYMAEQCLSTFADTDSTAYHIMLPVMWHNKHVQASHLPNYPSTTQPKHQISLERISRSI